MHIAVMSYALPFLFVSVAHVHGYSSGAPPSTCEDMLPRHNDYSTGGAVQIPPQTSVLPYNLQPSSTTYSPGQTVQMTLQSQLGFTFKGILVKVTTIQGTAVGRMTQPPTGYQSLTCDSVCSSMKIAETSNNSDEAITHSQGLIEKDDVTFSWTAPPTDSGPLTVRATVVFNGSTFWVNEQMATLAYVASQGSTFSPPPSLPPTSTPLQGGIIRYDPECGSSKGCFVDCNGDKCTYMATWRDDGQAITFELYGKPKQSDSWIAVGFSDDTEMGGDSVTECVHINGVVQAFHSYNTGTVNSRLANAGLTDISGSYQEGVLSCKFTRAKRVDGEPNIYDLDNDWNIMLAHGDALTGFGIAPHSLSSGELPPVSASQVDFQSFDVIGGAAKYPLVKAHGCLMILAWVLFTGIGIIVARFFKSDWADKTFLDLKIWFQIHRACMATTVVLDVVAFIIIFVEVEGYSEIPDIPGKSYLKSHPILGIIVTALCLANPVMAFFRPGPKSSKRPLFNWAHWSVGIIAYILSAVCICFGFGLGKSSTPDFTVYIMIGYVAYIVIFDLILDVHNFLGKRSAAGKIDAMDMGLKNGTDNGNATGENQKKNNDTLRTLLLLGHTAITGAFAILLVLLVALN